MKAAIGTVFAALTLLLGAAPASADFDLLPGSEGFEVTATDVYPTPDPLGPATRAGSHPYALNVELAFEPGPEAPGEPGVPFPAGDLKDLTLDLPPGLVENPTAVPRCSLAQFNTPRLSPFGESLSGESCPDKTQVGTVAISSSYGGGTTRTFGVFNLAPPSGFPSQLGFSPFGTPITIVPRIRESGSEYGLTWKLSDFPQKLATNAIKLTLWGTPWRASHDQERGNCLNEADPGQDFGRCPIGPPAIVPRQAYLTLPATCEGPLAFKLRVSAWQAPGTSVQRTSESPALKECEELSLFFNPFPVARISTARTTSATGFDFTLEGSGERLIDPELRIGAQVRRAVLTLPEGMTINPSVGAGLGVCTPSRYAAETLATAPGAGCPNDSKIGELVVQSPLFEGEVKGGLFLAAPDDPITGIPGAENPFDSLIALYMIARSPERGVMVRLAGKVVADPASGRLTATFDDLPQLPYNHFNVHFRDGQRSPLATPPLCGDYTTAIDLAPWSDPTAVDHDSSFARLDSGIGGGPCPNGKVAPFTPKSTAGTLNRNAGSYTPFYLHLTRTDAEQEITSYSASMPPGLLGKLKGVPFCPEAAIAAAKANSGFAESAEPSCPEASQIGHTNTGYGLGSVLAYGPGRLYLAGPYKGAPLSIAAVNSATVGPFDLGVIIVRSAIRIDRHTAQVTVDSTGSDPIPHIIRGIPLHLRDIRVYIDRPEFTLNPTSCAHFSAASSLTGSGPTFASTADDSRVAVPSPFQVANCSGLAFGPRLTLQLRGGTRRGSFPSLKATMRPRPGDANIGKVAVTLPPSEFLAQENLDTICTRVQFAANRCPPGSVYGQAKAHTPLLGGPMAGPVYLRASENKLPDLVAALDGNGIRVDVVGRIDTRKGGLRGTFEVLPDAPVSKFTMTLHGGEDKGLLANSENTCTTPYAAQARMVGQNNVGVVQRVRLTNTRCQKQGKPAGKGGRR